MNEKELRDCIESGMSHRKIAAHFGKSQTSIRYWLDKFNLKTDPYGHGRVKLDGAKHCNKCDITKSVEEFHRFKGLPTTYCKTCSTRLVLDRQVKFKLACLDYKGGRFCVRCGYDKSYVALDFHHRDSNEKDFSISRFKLYKCIDIVKSELDKCDVVCSNCHREIHHQLSKDQRDRRQEV